MSPPYSGDWDRRLISYNYDSYHTPTLNKKKRVRLYFWVCRWRWLFQCFVFETEKIACGDWNPRKFLCKSKRRSFRSTLSYAETLSVWTHTERLFWQNSEIWSAKIWGSSHKDYSTFSHPPTPLWKAKRFFAICKNLYAYGEKTTPYQIWITHHRAVCG